MKSSLKTTAYFARPNKISAFIHHTALSTIGRAKSDSAQFMVRMYYAAGKKAISVSSVISDGIVSALCLT
jgi:hypothetical protein